MSSLRRTDLGAGLARSAAFRLTLRFAAVFVVCLLLADLVVGSTARWMVRREALAAVEDTLGYAEGRVRNRRGGRGDRGV